MVGITRSKVIFTDPSCDFFFCFVNGWQMGSTDFDPRNRSSVKKADGSCCTPAQQSADVCRGQGLSVDISKADTSKAEDKIRILNCIRLPQARTKARSGAWLACPQMRTYSIGSPYEIQSRPCRSRTHKCTVFSRFFFVVVWRSWCMCRVQAESKMVRFDM